MVYVVLLSAEKYDFLGCFLFFLFLSVNVPICVYRLNMKVQGIRRFQTEDIASLAHAPLISFCCNLTFLLN